MPGSFHHWETNMINVLRLSGCVLLAASLVACNQSGPAEGSGEAVAPAPVAASPEADATQADVTEAAGETDVALTMPKARAYVQAVKHLHAAGMEDVTPEDGETLAQFEARLASEPEASAAIARAGMSVAEFARFGDVFLGAVTAQQLVDGGHLPAVPEGMEAAVAFVRENQAEIDALIASVDAADD